MSKTQSFICYPSFCLFKDEVVAGIESRIAAWTFLPEGEFLTMLGVNGLYYLTMYEKEVLTIHLYLMLWSENGEAIQILHYEHGQKYEPHFDYFYDKVNRELGGHRVATVLMYLSHVKRGGETVFPDAEVYYVW